MNNIFKLQPGKLSLTDIKNLLTSDTRIELDATFKEKIKKAHNIVLNKISNNEKIYGVTTGFGRLANKAIEKDSLTTLQHNLILSHACGVGENLKPDIVKLIILLKINCLSQGYSGVSQELIDILIKFYNEKSYPNIPEKGSVGASGDLAPLSHLALEIIKETKYQLKPKEGLALINGTQVSTAIAIYNYFQIENLFNHAINIGALTLDVCKGSLEPFSDFINNARGQSGQITVAKKIRELLGDSKIADAHKANNTRVQDPYSLRCQPQVLGAILDNMEAQKNILLNEANAVTDNPLVDLENETILTGGNFHGEYIAIACDSLAVCVSEIGALSERKIALLNDANFSGLPAFLIKDSGLNSGFMVHHVTASALASENKSLAHPASIDSIPTSANQEDHVSMATFSARRLGQMIDNTAYILTIELVCAAQGLEFLRPLTSSATIEEMIKKLRYDIDYIDADKAIFDKIEILKLNLLQGRI